MYRPLELFVGLRYTRAKRRNHFISFISIISMLGITLGVMALIIVLSVMNGFEKEMRLRILDMIAHLTVSGYDRQLSDWKQVVQQAKQDPRIQAAAPYIQAEGMLIYGPNVNGAIVRGVLPDMESGVSSVGKKMDAGQLQDLMPGKYGIILGRDLARILGVNVGDKVTMVTPSARVTPAGVIPRLKRFTVTGIFYIGMYEYDSAMALIHLDDAARVFQMKNEVTGVRLQLEDLFQAPEIRLELQYGLLDRFWVRDWSDYHKNWFRAVKIEKRMIFLLLLLVVVVAAFNIVSTLVIMVTDKEADIAIFRTLGMSPASIKKIFTVQGMVIGSIGTLLGGSLGVLAALNLEDIIRWGEELFGTKAIDASVYYISDLPSDLHWDDVWIICLSSLLISLIATLYPAHRASRTQPAQALRYE